MGPRPLPLTNKPTNQPITIKVRKIFRSVGQVGGGGNTSSVGLPSSPSSWRRSSTGGGRGSWSKAAGRKRKPEQKDRKQSRVDPDFASFSSGTPQQILLASIHTHMPLISGHWRLFFFFYILLEKCKSRPDL